MRLGGSRVAAAEVVALEDEQESTPYEHRQPLAVSSRGGR